MELVLYLALQMYISVPKPGQERGQLQVQMHETVAESISPAVPLAEPPVQKQICFSAQLLELQR